MFVTLSVSEDMCMQVEGGGDRSCAGRVCVCISVCMCACMCVRGRFPSLARAWEGLLPLRVA